MNGLLTDIENKAQFALPLIPMEYWLYNLNNWSFEINHYLIDFFYVLLGGFLFLLQLFLIKKYNEKRGQYCDPIQLSNEASIEAEKEGISLFKKAFWKEMVKNPQALHYIKRLESEGVYLVISIICQVYAFYTIIIVFAMYDNNKNYITWNFFMIYIICLIFLLHMTFKNRKGYSLTKKEQYR